jgi:hypothetical protein
LVSSSGSPLALVSGISFGRIDNMILCVRVTTQRRSREVHYFCGSAKRIAL